MSAQPTRDVESIYGLSPQQHGMLLHSAATPGSGVYVMQLVGRLDGDLDVEAFAEAWRRVMTRHPVLRTALVWKKLEQPVQVVHRELPAPLTVLDGRALSPGRREAELERICRTDQSRGFDTTRAPLMRLTLLHWAEDAHAFVWTHHHAILDGWSREIVLREVFALYGALRDGRDLALAPAAPYRDFVAWLKVQDKARAESYWRQKLRGITAPTPLPGARQGEGGSAADDLGGGPVDQLSRHLTGERTAALRSFAQRHGLTLYTLVLGAWALVLSRSSGERDVVFGVTTSGRTAPLAGIESMVGLLINTLPVRVRLPWKTPVLDWLRQLLDEQLEMQQLEHSPLAEVQGLSDVPRGVALFDSLLVFESYAESQDAGPVPELAVHDVRSAEKTHYPLTWVVVPGQRLKLGALYRKDLLRATAVRRLLGAIETVLGELAARPERPLGEVAWLNEGLRHQCVREWNDTAAAGDGPPSLHRRFEAQARKSPNAVAVVFEGESLSYRELNRRANRLARHLADGGVGPDMTVAVAMERSLELLVALFAVLKAGGAYVPLEVSYPAERLAFQLADCRAPVVLTQEHLAGSLPPSGARCVVVPRDPAALHAYSDADLDTAAGGEALAYTIYTSGSTGRPKGAMVSHRAITNRLAWMQSAFGLAPGEGVLQKTPFSFDVSVWEFFWPLLVGGRLVVAKPDGHQDAAYLQRLIAAQDVTTLHFVPSMLQHFLSQRDLSGCASLRRVIASGEALPADLAQRCLARLPGAELHNLYGPTEAAVDVTAWPCRPGLRRVPIGRPIHNIGIFVLDAGLEPVPPGVPGELYIGGAGLGRGYLRRPALCAERFLPHPFGETAGERLYRTGDRASFHVDGAVEFLGRVDFQVKLRGLRVELGEIEAALTEAPEIREAVVLAHEAGPGDQRLVACLVASGESPPEAAALRRFLETKLPRHMVPSSFVPLERLPLSPNGKVDRRALSRQALPDGAALSSPAARELTPPRTPLEEDLCGIFAKTLGVERVGIDDDFFALGGHSLLAMQIVARLQERLAVDVPLGRFFAAPRVRELAAAVNQLKDEEAVLASLPAAIEPDPDRLHEPFPLTRVQQAYWVGRSAELELGNVSAHSYTELELVGFDLGRFERAWRRLIERHPMLRAIVRSDGRQQILEHVPPFRVETLDLRGKEAEAAEAALEEVRERMFHQVLPSDRWPLFDLRASLLPGGRIRLHLSLDALIRDASSDQILLRELAVLYQDAEAPLPPLHLSFRDYVLAEENLRESEVYRLSREYWLDRLDEIDPAPELPMSSAPLRHPRFTHRGHRLAAARWQELKRRASRIGLTASGVLLAAFAEVLAAWSKKPRFTLNLTLVNRLPMHPQVGEIVGDFTSVTLLTVDARGGRFEDRAQRLQSQLWADLDHRFFSGIEVLRELTRRRGELAAAMPVVFTSTLGITAPGQEVPDLAIESRRVYSSFQTPQVWLDHMVAEQDGELILTWSVVEELFLPGVVDQAFCAYTELVEGLADADETWDQDRSALVPPEHLALYAAVNATEQELPGGLLHDPFFAQAERSPEAPAVLAGGRVLSYGELRRRSHELARHLRRLGARPNRLVAVVMEKGWEQVVAVLAILEAGAAYLPVDAQLPAARIRHLLEAGEVELALTQSWLEPRMSWDGIRHLAVDRSPEAPEIEPLGVAQSPQDLAYVIFTSGSTGQPKGVMIDHRGALNTVLDVNQRFSIGAGDRVLALSRLSFDLSVWDVFGTLAAGGTLVMPAASRLRDPAHWVDLVARHGVTVWNSVPALAEMLVEYAASRPAGTLPSLRLVLLSGDWIPLALPGQLRTLLDEVEVISLGGATEASIWSILYPIGAVEEGWTSIPYGVPMANQSFHVLDEDLAPRPVGVPGELYIGGIGVAKGYWGDPEKTARSFLTDPRTGACLYRTGDLGRYLADGNIEFLGREDFQVKVQGHRIELGEIESTLAQHPALSTAVVLVAGEPRGKKRLVAYVVPRFPEEPPDADTLRAFLAARLPAYMVPASFVTLPRLPLTANGKVDRSALSRQTPSLLQEERRTAPEVALSATGARVADVVAGVLGLASIDVTASLIELGASSFDIVRVANKLEEELGTRPPMEQLFQQPVAEAVISFYDERLGEGDAAAALPEPAGDGDWQEGVL